MFVGILFHGNQMSMHKNKSTIVPLLGGDLPEFCTNLRGFRASDV